MPTGQGKVREIWFTSMSSKSGIYVKWSVKLETVAVGYDNEYVEGLSSLSAYNFKEIFLLSK